VSQQTRELTFSFEQPNVALSLNKSNSMHWATRRRHLEPWRTMLRMAYNKATLHQEMSIGPVDIAFTFTFARNGRRDPHNYIATVKPLIDELVDLALVPDDTAEWVSVAEPKLRISDDNLCHVSIRLRDE
jgi:hypothetical protein